MDSWRGYPGRSFYIRLACLSAATLGACSTVTRGTAYEESSDSAYLVVAASGIGGRVSDAGFTFRRFDVERHVFAPEYFFVSFERIASDTFKKPSTLQTDLRFGGKAVPPGDYALISRYDVRGYLQRTCFSLGTRVYRIRPGHVNVIYGAAPGETGSANLATIEQQTKAVLQDYPKISAPVAPAEILGKVAFGDTEKPGTSTCTTAGPITYIPVR